MAHIVSCTTSSSSQIYYINWHDWLSHFVGSHLTLKTFIIEPNIVANFQTTAIVHIAHKKVVYLPHICKLSFWWDNCLAIKRGNIVSQNDVIWCEILPAMSNLFLRKFLHLLRFWPPYWIGLATHQWIYNPIFLNTWFVSGQIR